MARARRSLLWRELQRMLGEDDFLPRAEAMLAACPEAAQITDEEAEDCLMVAQFLETVHHYTIRACMRTARIPVPPEISFDEYRLARHIFRRWGDPEVRTAIITRGVNAELGPILRFLRSRDPERIRRALRAVAPAAIFALMRKYGAPDLVQTARSYLDEAQQAKYQATLAYLKVKLHRLMTEHEPPRRPTHWDRAKLARRLQLRDVQMRSMRKSVHHLRRERKALMVRLRETSQQEQPELQSLAAQLTELRTARAEAEREAALELEAQAARHRAELDRLRTELAQLQADLADGLAARQLWLTAGKGVRRDEGLSGLVTGHPGR